MHAIDPTNLCPGCMLPRPAAGLCPCGYAGQPNLPHQLPVGAVLDGKYLIGRALGQGGFGITYIAMDLNLEIRVAIKEYYPEGLVSRDGTGRGTVFAHTGQGETAYAQGRERFLKEARVLAQFQYLPGVVTVREFFAANNTAYIVMEYIEGETLKAAIAKAPNNRLPAESLLAKLEPLMEALEIIHSTGLLHRDISPDNIMERSDGSLVLLDFGAARQFSLEGEHSNTINVKHGYAPEEQYRSRGEQGPWTDVYALCATIYKLTTGVTPPQAMDRMAGEAELTPPRQLGADLTPAQEAAVRRGMAVKRSERTQSIALLRAELSQKSERPVSKKPLPEQPKPTPPKAHGKGKSKKTKGRIGVVIGLLLVAAVAIGTGLGKNQVVPVAGGEPVERAEAAVNAPVPNVLSNLFSDVQPRKATTYVECAKDANGFCLLPDVVGEPREKAEKLLMDSGVLVKTVEGNSSLPGGEILTSMPPAGTAVERGSTVILLCGVEAIGGEDVIMPELDGMLEEDASRQLEKLGLHSETTPIDTLALPAGYTAAQYPLAGAACKAGDTVLLGVSSGRPAYRLQYSYADRLETKENQSELEGWTLIDYEDIYGDYSAWSAWEESEPTEGENTQVESKKQYRFRQRETTESMDGNLSGWTQDDRKVNYGEYGSWSSWSEGSAPSRSDTVDVETQTHTTWMVVWAHYCKEGNQPTDDFSVKYASHSFDGADYHYWKTEGPFESEPESLATDENGPPCPTIGATKYYGKREKETVSYYRYRQREMSVTYYYHRWSDWSSWADTKTEKGDGREVETRTLYRKREKEYLGKAYHYWKWDEWSPWQDMPVFQSDTRTVRAHVLMEQ